MSTLVTLRIDPDLWQQFKTEARSRNTTASAAIKEFIQQYLQPEDEDEDWNEDWDEDDQDLDEDEDEDVENNEQLIPIDDWKRGDTFKDVNYNIGRFLQWTDANQQEAEVLLVIGSTWKPARIPASSLVEKLS